jgi:hypothetical protein
MGRQKFHSSLPKFGGNSISPFGYFLLRHFERLHMAQRNFSEQLMIMPATKIQTGARSLNNPGETPWVYGWTHRGMTGQTKARMDKLTREIEIKDRQNWVRCIPGSDVAFTPRSNPESSHLQKS